MKTNKTQKTYSLQESKEAIDGYVDQSALRLQKRLKTGLKKRLVKKMSYARA